MSNLAVGDVLAGKYEIKAVLGAGGMGTVYRARQIDLGRDVAIKIPNPAALDLPGFRARFSREAKLVARLVHDNIVQVYEYIDTEDSLYIVMEYVEGVDLKALIMKPPVDLTVRDIAIILRGSCEGLAHAHEMGIVHRDIKPHNIMVQQRGRGKWRVKIMDFGIAHLDESTANTTMNQEQLTVTGQAIGTPSYMSPEQIRGTGVTAESDVYSFGCVAYFCFSKQTPFVGTGFTVAASHLSELPPPIRTKVPSLPPPLEAIINRCLEKEPSRRPADAAELGQEIYEALQPIFDYQMSRLWPGPGQEGGITDVIRPTAPVVGVGEGVTQVPNGPPNTEAATVIVGNPGMAIEGTRVEPRPAPPPANPAALDPRLSEATLAIPKNIPAGEEATGAAPPLRAKGRNPVILVAMISMPVMLLGVTLAIVLGTRDTQPEQGQQIAQPVLPTPTPSLTPEPTPPFDPTVTPTPEPLLATPTATPRLTPTPPPTPTPDPVLGFIETLKARFAAAEANLLSRISIWRLAATSDFAQDPRVQELADGFARTIALSPELIAIPAGNRTIGVDGDPDAFSLTNVRLSAFMIGRFEVTALEFSAFLNGIPSEEASALFQPTENSNIIQQEATGRFIPRAEKELHPANFVTWDAAVRYTMWISSMTGESFSLPTEAQWEVAARGGTTQRFPWGESPPTPQLANYAPQAGTLAVTDLAPGRNVLNGMAHAAGNVAEWCLDWYRSDFDPGQAGIDPQGPAAGRTTTRRVVRGGSFTSPAQELATYRRDSATPSTRRVDLGFRIVRQP